MEKFRLDCLLFVSDMLRVCTLMEALLVAGFVGLASNSNGMGMTMSNNNKIC